MQPSIRTAEEFGGLGTPTLHAWSHRVGVQIISLSYVLWAIAFVCASLAAAWVSGAHIGSCVKASVRVAGQDLGWLLGVLGVSVSALKALLPLERVRSGGLACGNAFYVLVLLALCLFYSWGAAMFAALQISAVSELPLHLVLFLSAAWALVEIGGSLLPAVAWVVIRGQHHRPRAFSCEAPAVATKPCMPFARDVAELVQRIRQEGKIPPHLVGIDLAPDGTILTSQSALAKALGQSKATVHRRLHALCASGAITLATDGSCTRIGVGAYATALAA